MRGLRAGVFIAVGLFAANAQAATKDQCISAFDQGQTLRRGGHLKQAREQLLVCAQQECPSVLRADCSDVLRQVEAAMPSIVLRIQDANGLDVTNVQVELNGAPLTNASDGRAIPVDPGKVTINVKQGTLSVTVDAVVAEAEKNRIVKVTIGGEPQKKPEPVKPAPPPEPARDVVGYAVPGALAAIGVAGFVIAGVTRLGAGSDADDAKKSCGPVCPESTRDHLSSELVRANIFFGVGIGGVVAAAATWFILAPRSQSATSAALTSGVARW